MGTLMPWAVGKAGARYGRSPQVVYADVNSDNAPDFAITVISDHDRGAFHAVARRTGRSLQASRFI